ncbi:YhdP family protein [Alteromonas sp. ASW11-19]|uniref:YhdP family protein n=1 Tax=Alteromonas salexigens TaxID=2982530 RepID=A0ABT2VMY7_9ALTE|nr:YhdP family protein [Alteromonas salexigens]MCU7554680.1 YhdP family protein [Alteromonas salexigens]
MTKLSTVTTWLVKKLWLTLAALLVLFAVLLSVMRYALPHIEHKKYLLEDYVNQRYGVDLSINSVHAVWQSNGPSVVLNKVELAKSASSPVALEIDEVYVELDFWSSLAQQVVSSRRFELVGLKLDIDAERLEGASDSDYPVVDALQHLFLEQLQQFSLHQGEVTLTRNGKPQTFDLEALSWINQGNRHQGRGSIQVRDVSSNSASFLLDLYGDKDNLEGLFYAKAEDLDISPWVSEWLKIQRPLSQSRANFEVWSEVKNSALSRVHVNFERSLLEWSGETGNAVYTGVRGGSIQALPVNDDWNLRVDQLILDSNRQTLVTDLVGKLSPDGELLLNTVKPVAINPFSMLLPLFSSDTSVAQVDAMQPEGQLATLQLQWTPAGPAVAAKLLDVSWSQAELIPGLSSLDVDVYWSHNQGSIRLASHNSTLETDNLLSDNLSVDKLSADIYVYAAGEGDERAWWVETPNLSLETNKLSLHQQARYDVQSGALQSITQVNPLALNEVGNLLPEPLMGEKTTAYLRDAFVGEGNIEHARILWDGQASDFPFTDNSGIFQAIVGISDADFQFSPDWPGLTALDLSLKFENDGLVIASCSGKLQQVDVTNMRAEIPTLSASSTLTIDATGTGSAEDVTALMVNSMLRDSLGSLLTDSLQVTGDLTTSLSLAIPFNGDKPIARGTATLNDNNIYVVPTQMAFTQASGDIHFNNDKVEFSGLQAKLLEQPVTLEMDGYGEDDRYMVALGLQGKWSVAPLSNRFNPALGNYLGGESDWQAQVSLQIPKDGFSYTATVTAPLTGIGSALPAPFNKQAGQPMMLSVSSEGNQHTSTIAASLGEQVRFDGILPHQEFQFSRAHLALGNSDFVGLGVGFSISAVLDKIDVGSWYKTIEMLIGGSSEGEGGLFGVPERIFANTGELTFAGQTLNDVAVTAKQVNNNWLLDVNAEQARATINLYDQWLQRGIEIEADYLSLAQWESNEDATAQSWNADTLPPVYFHCQQCSLLGRDLGEVTLDVTRAPDGMIVRQAKAEGRHGTLLASGKWLFNNHVNQTHMTGTLRSDDVGAMLSEYGIDSGIKDSEADIDFDLHWPQSPMDFTLASVTGDIHWGLTDGYLTEISDQGSRIFTLFSLNSLVRKLSLDFRDVFAKGFFYDEMGGSLTITDGKAFTDDTEIDGGAGEIEIQGYTDLVAKKLNYNVSFAPNVTGNLPFLVYFLATPQTALAALAIDQVLTSAKVISNVNYHVTGTISEPVINEIGRDSKDIELPAKATPPAQEQGAPLNEDDLQRFNMEVRDGRAGSDTNDIDA